MMTDEEMEKEADRRIKNMSPEERQRLEKEISEGLDLENKFFKVGSRSLSRMEEVKFAKFKNQDIKAINNTGFNDYQDAEIEAELINGMHLSKEEIQKMKKNPYKAGFFKSLILAAIPTLGLVATSLMSKYIGVDIPTSVVGAFGGLSSLLSLYSARMLVKAARVHHVKKSYNSKYEENLINNKVFLKIKEDVKRGKGM